MPTVKELAREGVGIGDRVEFPSGGSTHTATIVGPKDFPYSHLVYLAPPEPGNRGLVMLYNPETGERRDTFKFEGEQKIELTPRSDELLVEQIHIGYSLFERA